THLIAATLRHPQPVTAAALRGAHNGTMPLTVIHSLTKHPLTDKGIEQFQADWNKELQRAAHRFLPV
ncbi:hypothetical protein MMJ17_24610, partial [Bacillus spizizenii]|nr:hypothetical protein [Bacillus spizizenii]